MKSDRPKAFRRALVAIAPVLVALAIGASAGAVPVSPKGVIEQFHQDLIGVMKDAKTLGFRGRFEALSPAIANAFHLPAMTRIVAGRHWKRFTRRQKQALVDAFGRMTAATYAFRFDGYGGERFRTTGEVMMRPGTVLLKTELVKTDGEAVALDYLVRNFKSGWRVIDIYLKGSYSELATRRSEYSSVLRRRGLDALIALIDSKIAAYHTGAGNR